MTTAQQAPQGTLHCPQCASALDESQDWCLHCGRGARTRVLPAGNWRIPILAACLVAAIAGAGLASVFLALSGDDERIVTSGELTTTITVTTEGAAPPVATPTVPVTPTAPPTQTAPPQTTPTSPSKTKPGGG